VPKCSWPSSKIKPASLGNSNVDDVPIERVAKVCFNIIVRSRKNYEEMVDGLKIKELDTALFDTSEKARHEL
jgi:hypothetical protein